MRALSATRQFVKYLSLAAVASLSIACETDEGEASKPDLAEQNVPQDASRAQVDQMTAQISDTSPQVGPEDMGTGDQSMPMIDAGAVTDSMMVSSADQGVTTPSIGPLFIIAGQSNAEGNAFHLGLRRLIDSLPAGDAPLTPEERIAARRAVALSQGAWCGEDRVTDATADTVVDGLRTTPIDWRRFDLDYRHPTVQIRAKQYDYAPVRLETADGQPIEVCDDCDLSECREPRADGLRIGPELNAYTQDDLAPLAVGFGAREDPEDGKLYGPELSFGAGIGEFHPNSVILKVAMGGSSLGDHWRLDGPMYSTLVTETTRIRAETNAELGALIWFQGFNDQFEDVYCDALTPPYGERLRALVDALRRDLSATLPVVIVKARNGGNLGPIQAAQDAVANALDGVITVETADLSECFHYDSGAQIMIGVRIAAAVRTILGESAR